MTNSTNKPNATFWVITIVALLWNIMGVVAYLGQVYMTDEALNSLPINEQTYYNFIPAWVTAAFAISVFSGVLGCLALLFRKKWAIIFFALSLFTIIIQFIYNFFIQKFMEISGTRIVMPVVVIVISLFLVWYSRKSTKSGWIH